MMDVAINLILDQDGVPKRRPGTKNYGETLTGSKDGDGVFAVYDSERMKLVEKNIAVVDGVVKTAVDATGWTAATGVTLTPGRQVSMLAIDDKVLLANATDNLAMYDPVSNEVSQITAIDNPGTPTLTRSSDLANGSITLRYQITAINAVGETAGSTIATINVNKQRSNWQNTTGTDGKSENITLSWTNVPGAVRYNIYFNDAPDKTYYIDSIGASAIETTTYIDEARVIGNMALPCPEENETGGPKFAWLSYSDNHVFGGGDPRFPWRVFWGGLSENVTAFNWYYGGGWVDINRGGDEVPAYVRSYKDGKGEPINTVFMTNAAGVGDQYQITLATITTGETAAVVPMLARVIGSLGTSARGSVIETQNNLFYLNKDGVFTTGAKADILNSLSTDEVGLAVRREVRSINSDVINQAQAVLFDGNILFAVPYNDTVNNEVWVLDMELKTWVRPWKLGVKQFIRYTDSSGKLRLLYRPSGENGDYLVELSEEYNTDNGVPFEVRMATSLMEFDESHFAFERVKKVYLEFLKATGKIDVIISGDLKGKQMQILKSLYATEDLSYAGFNNELFNSSLFNEAVGVIELIRKPSTKKVIRINKTLNNIKVEMATNSLVDFALSMISVVGVPRKVSDPSAWKR
jgi:hypothetical protein